MRRNVANWDWLRAGLVVGVIVLSSCGGSEISQDEVDALNDQIAELEAQIAELEAQLAESASQPDAAASTTAITGTFTVIDTYESSRPVGLDRCSTKGGFDDIRVGTQVVVRDGSSGGTLAKGELEQGFWVPTDDGSIRYCEFPLLVEDVPTDYAFYEIEVGSRGSQTYSAEELAEQGWEVAFTLGP